MSVDLSTLINRRQSYVQKLQNNPCKKRIQRQLSNIDRRIKTLNKSLKKKKYKNSPYKKKPSEDVDDKYEIKKEINILKEEQKNLNLEQQILNNSPYSADLVEKEKRKLLASVPKGKVLLTSLDMDAYRQPPSTNKRLPTELDEYDQQELSDLLDIDD